MAAPAKGLLFAFAEPVRARSAEFRFDRDGILFLIEPSRAPVTYEVTSRLPADLDLARIGPVVGDARHLAVPRSLRSVREIAAARTRGLRSAQEKLALSEGQPVRLENRG
mgnify:CR=1 FL=1